MKTKPHETALDIPPTRTHHQLAAWVNHEQLVDHEGRAVVASAEKSWSSTDQKIRGTRLRRPGKGRKGVRLLLRLRDAKNEPDFWRKDTTVIFRHDTAETYRRHDEARRWIIDNLRKSP